MAATTVSVTVHIDAAVIGIIEREVEKAEEKRLTGRETRDLLRATLAQLRDAIPDTTIDTEEN